MGKNKAVKDDSFDETNMVESVTVADVEKAPVDERASVRKVFEQSEGVACRSIVEGGLFMQGLKTQMIYSWSGYGDVSEVEYRDLAAAVRSKSKFVYNPWFIIEDKDFLAEFPQIEKFYESCYSLRELKAILNMENANMVKAIKGLPSGAFESLKSIAAKQVSTGMLDSVSKIRALDSVFGTDLNLMGELIRD